MLDTNLALFVEVRPFHSQLYERIDPEVVHRVFLDFPFFKRFKGNSKIGGRTKINIAIRMTINANCYKINNNNKQQQQTTYNKQHTTTNNSKQQQQNP